MDIRGHGSLIQKYLQSIRVCGTILVLISNLIWPAYSSYCNLEPLTYALSFSISRSFAFISAKLNYFHCVFFHFSCFSHFFPVESLFSLSKVYLFFKISINAFTNLIPLSLTKLQVISYPLSNLHIQTRCVFPRLSAFYIWLISSRLLSLQGRFHMYFSPLFFLLFLFFGYFLFFSFFIFFIFSLSLFICILIFIFPW